ncbi:PhnD/SsuA/transferrin family substrate-binding protein [Halobellus sp. EA9]|uniref:PhnD/SsuA/transferrin family substrate-binding protein n=1 Tax=Halobellus sp. EA9 TaxID=3421647 RepID=UPI003EB87349
MDSNSRSARSGIEGTATRRRFLLGGAATAATAGLAGCSSVLGGSGNGGSKEKVTMLLTPGTPGDLRPRYKPVVNMLNDKVDGVDVEMKVPQNYSAIKPALESEQAEIAMDDVTLISNPDLMNVYGTTVTGGSAFYFSVMLVPLKSSIDERTDVKGKDWAFADRLSTSGSIFALYTLEQAGLDIGEAPKGDPVDFDGSWTDHNQAVQRVANGKADGCTTWGGNGIPHIPKKYKSDFPKRVKEKSSFLDTIDTEKPKLRPIWWSFPIPKQPIYARKSWDSPKKERIGEVLINSDKQTIQQYYPKGYNESKLPFTTLRDTSMKTYRPVIKRMNAVGIDPAA